MLIIKEKVDRNLASFNKLESTQTLTLPFEIRQKARFVARLDNDQEVGIQIERGHILRDGDKLKADDGTVVKIIAGDESVSTVKSDDQKLLSRVCYHLGNRHVPLQVEQGWCRYTNDYVLDEMVVLLGAEVINELAPFEPEAGAYAQGHGSHSHGSHGHGSHAALSDESKPSVTDIDGINSFEVI